MCAAEPVAQVAGKHPDPASDILLDALPLPAPMNPHSGRPPARHLAPEVVWDIAYGDGRAATLPYGADARWALILYTADGWMNACIARGGRPRLSGDSMRRLPTRRSPGRLRKLLQLRRPLHAARSTAGRPQVVHRVTMSLNPNFVGSEQVRDMHFDAEGRLTLSAADTVPGSDVAAAPPADVGAALTHVRRSPARSPWRIALAQATDDRRQPRAMTEPRHPAPRAGAAGRPDAGVGHQLAAVRLCGARDLGVDLPRHRGHAGRRDAAGGGACARPVAGHSARVLADHRAWPPSSTWCTGTSPAPMRRS